jgi:dipeptidyl aminopeptidase/acylaminoacyl peptidase
MRYVVSSMLVLCLLIIGSFGLTAGEPHPFTVKDLLAMDRVSSQDISPDGKMVAFVVRKTDLEANKGRTDLWVADIDGRNLRRLTANPAADYNPLWSKDGKLVYFISTRSGSSQVWRIAKDGGEAAQITNQELDLDNLKLSPDGTKMAFTMEVFPKATVAETVKKLAARKNMKISGRIYDKLFFRHWDTWKDGRRSHIFVAPIAGGTAVDVMKGLDVDSPLKPFGGSEEFTFSPDSKSIVYTAANSGRKAAWSTNYDLFKVPIDGSAAAKNLTEAHKAWDTTPVFSNDGKTLSYLRMKRPGFEADKFDIILRNLADGKERVLTENWDRSASDIVWGPKNKVIYTYAGNLGQRALFAIDVKTAKVKTLVKMGQVRGVAVAGKNLIYGLNTLGSPTELFSIDMKGKKSKQITNINAKQMAAVKMSPFEQFTFKGWNNEEVYAYVVYPVDFDANKKYPVAFLIHGGPQGSFGNSFHYRWNPQVYTARGYAAVMVDFHGSTGYGQAFTDSISGDWGGKPLEDLQKGLAAALKKYSWMDGKRVGALGASYGGYMINWIAGNWSDRFKCLINHDGNLDERFAYYDTEELWFPEWEHGGTPWDNPKGYAKHNPIDYVKNWKTPMLVIHGALDYRVVETQGFATFTALQRKGIPSKMLYFPDENHWVLQPHNSILWHNTVLDWLDKWTK